MKQERYRSNEWKDRKHIGMHIAYNNLNDPDIPKISNLIALGLQL